MRNLMRYFVFLVLALAFGYTLAKMTQIADPVPAKQVKLVTIEKPLIPVAIIDSGFDLVELKANKVNLCPKRHYDATYDTEGVGLDWTKVQHGTKMALLVNKYSKGKACLILIKALDKDDVIDNIIYINRALNHLIKMGTYPRVISMSYSGPKYSLAERTKMMQLGYSNQSVMFVAAGNDDKNLDEDCSIYPACYEGLDKMVVVSARSAINHNYGDRITLWEKGSELGIKGTSVATAIAAGKYAEALYKEQR